MATKSREKILAISVGVGLGLLVLNSVVFNPLMAAWHARQTGISELRAKIARGKSEMRSADSLDGHWNRMLTNTLPVNHTLAESILFNAFDTWARTSGVILAGQKPENKDSDDPSYSNMEWRADVTGNIRSIPLFLYAVESSPIGLKVESVELTSKDDYGRQLALGLTVSGLILNPATSASP